MNNIYTDFSIQIRRQPDGSYLTVDITQLLKLLARESQCEPVSINFYSPFVS